MRASEGGTPGNPEAYSLKSWNPVICRIVIFYGVSARHSFEKREDGCTIKNVGHDKREGRFLPTAPRGTGTFLIERLGG